ncbi:MAG: HPr family phosphocarrier protein [Pseudomonadota bacterium]|nr:HPr family phosphocarrier protein [Pseudomonadota bacterium]
MRHVNLPIVNKLGLHARASSKFIRVARQFRCNIEIGIQDGELVDAKSILNVLTLAADKGTVLSLKVNGEDEDEAIQALISMVADRFGEAE